MYRSVCVALALLALLVPGGRSCPRTCNCYQTSEVHCTFRSLLTIPPGLPSHTRRINLGFNSINRIQNSSLVGLKRVELLMLHSNDLHHLQDGVFRDMKSLQILKLSYNKLSEISSSLTFSGLTSLLRLYLDHNLLQHIHPRALLQLPSLRLLRLQGNRLHQLHPHSLCTLSLLNTYYFSTLRHLDLSNNSLTALAKDTLETAPLLETLVLQANPWSCDCGMNWLLTWSLAHPGLLKCPSGPQCPTCASPDSLRGRGLLDQTDLSCTSPVIPFPGRKTPLEKDISEILSSETLREPLGTASVGLSDQQGSSVDLRCNITLSNDSQDIGPPPDLSSSSPIPLALSLSLECPVERESYERLWRILAYYSETAVRLEREIMLSKAPELAYRYRQAAETDGYYHTGVKASVKARPQWLLQPAVSIQLNRAQSNRHKVHLIYSTRVSAQPGPASPLSTSSHASPPWVLISTNHTITAMAAVSGSKVELTCPLLSSGNPKVQWILPDGSKLISPSSSLGGRLQASATILLIQKLQLSDAGLYYCVAQADKDIDVLPVRLGVEESSVPLSGEEVGLPVTGTFGEFVSLSCKASGSPEPYISWVLPDGNILRTGLAASGGLTLQPNGSLSLPNPSPRDAGHYRCIAVNRYGSDSLSMQLELKPQHSPPLRTSFPRGPQSAAGRSTKIRAPLLRQMEEGSGDEEEVEERMLAGDRKSLRPQQRLPNRQPLPGQPRRRGPVRVGPLRRGGGPVTSTDQRRNRFDNRHRVATNKQRIDPQKWADLLAKIRQKTPQTTTRQPITAGEPTAEPARGGKERDTSREEEVDDMDRRRSEGAGEETEGSSVDDTVLQEEGLQPIHPVRTEMPTHTQTITDPQLERVQSATETQTNIETKMRMQTQSPQVKTVTNRERQTIPIKSKSTSGSNDIVPGPAEGDNRGTNAKPSRTRLQNPRQRLLPHLIPNSRPQSPWNARRRIGQQRRIINRPRVPLLTPPRPLPDPTHPRSQTATPDTTKDQSNVLLLVATTSPSMLLTRNDHIKMSPSGGAMHPLSPPVSTSLGIYTSEPSTPSLTSSSPSHQNPRVDIVNHLDDILDTAASPLFDTATPAPTHYNVVISPTHVPETHVSTPTHGIQTQTTIGKQDDIPSSKHSEEQERNLLGVSYKSPSTTPLPTSTHSSILSSTVSTAATVTTATTTPTTPGSNFTSLAASTTSTSTIKTSEATFVTTTTPVTAYPVMYSTASSIIPTSITTRSTTTASSSTSTINPILTSTTPPTTTTSSTKPYTTPHTTITSSTRPSTTPPTTTTSSTIPSTTTTTSSTSPSTTTTTSTTTSTGPPTTTTTPTVTSTKSSINAILKTLHHSTTTTRVTTTASNRITTSAIMSPTTTRTPTFKSSTTTTTSMTSTSTRTSFRERPIIGSVDARGRPVPGSPNQSRTPDWKNPGANSIPDSHSSRPHWSPSLPAVPGTPVVRSRPRIADPHIRTVSFPADSSARLACEAQGEPKPSITWTKVATGAVMSIHSKVPRLEVFPNGTLVIRNVQLQDRGTYICSAHSYLGRDRLLTTLEVWTRPPRMQLASYRESTIHQGGEVLLECRADGVPAPLLSWVLPDRSVLTSAAPSASRIVMDSNGTLHVLAALPGDRGVYRCVASNPAGAASSSVRLHVSSLPPVIQQPREEHLLLSPGRPVYAHCSARGAPPPTLRWRIPDGTLVRPSQFLHGNLFVLPNGTLHIRGVGPKDLGSYECTASNAVGTDKRTVRVKIVGEAGEGKRERGKEDTKAVVIEKAPPPYSLNKDRTLSVPNHAINPFNSPKLSPPVLADKSRTLPINPSSARSSLHPRQPNSTTSPPQIHKTLHTPTHSTNINKTKLSPFSLPSKVPANNTRVSPSIARNTAVSSSSPTDNGRASAVLHPLPVFPFSKARIVSTSPAITTVHYGGTLQLHCSVTGNPTPIIIWRTPNRKLVDMHFSFDRRMKVHPNGTLSAQAVTEKEAGDYLCIARNKVADDYRLLRVSVAMKPAKIVPKHPLNQMVSFGKPLKVDCQASGLPDPAVHWSLPDGTMVNSVLQGEHSGGRVRRLTVFENGTLLVPSVGMGEEGEYTCYAKNQGGQDTMKVKVKVMMTSPPTFKDEKSYHVIKVHRGATAKIRCQATGSPAPTTTWLSPASRVIPRTSGSGYYTERVVVVWDGTLEVRLAQEIDTGNYTCRAISQAGERSMVVGLEVQPFNHVIRGQMNNAGIIQLGFTNGASSKPSTRNSATNNNGYSDKIGNSNPEPNIGSNTAPSGSYPALRSDSQQRFNRPVSGITTQLGSSVLSVGGSGARTIGIKADNSGINRNGPGFVSGNSNSAGNGHSTVRGESAQRNPGSNYNDVIAGRASNDDNNSRDNGRIRGISRNAGVSSGVTNSGFGTGSLGRSWFSQSSHAGLTRDDGRNSGDIAVSNIGSKNPSNTAVGVVTTVKQQAVKGRTVLLPCPSQGSPPPRLSWLLPGNGVLPTPYYGSRLTVYRNGSLELRSVRVTDAGTLVCVARGERGETRLQVELEVSEPQEEATSSHRAAAAVGSPVLKTAGLKEAAGLGASLDSARPLSSVLPEKLHPRLQVTQKPPQRGLSLQAAPRPLGPPPRSVLEPAASTRTASLVSIINGETLHLPCPAPQTPTSLSWTTPSGNMLTRGESGDSGRLSVREDGSLTVQQATVFDRGTYTCTSMGPEYAAASVLTVPVIVIAYPPRITSGPSPVTYTRPGVAVELPCLNIATPRATVTWETPDLTQLRVMGQARIYGNRYLSPQGSLVIQNPTSRDTGFYRCTAKNVIGVDTKATYLHVI